MDLRNNSFQNELSNNFYYDKNYNVESTIKNLRIRSNNYEYLYKNKYAMRYKYKMDILPTIYE